MTEATLGTAILRAILDKSGYDTSLQTLKRDTENELRQVQQSFTDTMNNISNVTMRWGAGLSGAVTLPLTLLGKAGVASAMQLETFSASLNVIIGDAERANRVFEDLYEFSANVPFNWRQLSNATVTLAAFGSEAEDIIPQLQMIGDIAAGIQAPIDEIAKLFGRVQIAGRLSMQEVNSLGDRGVPIYTELAKQFNITTAEVRDFVSAGNVGFDSLNRMFIELTSEGGKFFGMMEAQSEVTAGKWNRLKDSFEQVTDLIGERLLPTINALIEAGQSATEWFVNLDESVQTMIISIGVFAAALGPVLLGISGLTRAIGFLSAAMMTPFGPLGLVALAVAGLTAFLMHLDRVTKGTTDYAGEVERLNTAIRLATEAQDQQLMSSVNARQALQDLANATNENGVLGAVNALIEALQGDAKTAMSDFAVSTIAPLVQQGRLQEAINQTILKFIELRIEANRAKLEVLEGLREEVQANIDELNQALENSLHTGFDTDNIETAILEAQDRITRGYGQLSGYGLKLVEENGKQMVMAYVKSTGEIVREFRVGMEPLLDEILRLNYGIGSLESPVQRATREAIEPFTEQAASLTAEIDALNSQVIEYTQLSEDLASGAISTADAIALLDEDLAEIFTRFDLGNRNTNDTKDTLEDVTEAAITLSSVLADLKSGLENVRIMTELVGDEFDAAGTTADLFQAAAQALIDNGIVPATTDINELIEALQNFVAVKEDVTSTFDEIGGAIQKLSADIFSGRQDLEAIQEQLEGLREGVQARIDAVSEGGITSPEELQEYVKLVGQLRQIVSLLEDIEERQKPVKASEVVRPPTGTPADLQQIYIDRDKIIADTNQAVADAMASGRIVPLTLEPEVVLRDAPTALAMFEMLKNGYTEYRDIVEEPLGPPGGIPEYFQGYVDFTQHQISTAANNAAEVERIMRDTVQGMADSIEEAREAGDQPLFDNLIREAQEFIDRYREADGTIQDSKLIDLVELLPEEVTGVSVPLTLTPEVEFNEVVTEVDKIQQELAENLERARVEASLFGDASMVASQSQSALLQAIRAFLDEGLEPSSQEIQEALALYLAYQQFIDETAAAKRDEAEASREAAEEQRALNAAQQQFETLSRQIYSAAGQGDSVFDEMRDDLAELATQIDIDIEEMQRLLDLIDELEREQGIQDTMRDINQWVGIAGDVLGGFSDLLDGDVLGGLRGVAVGVGELIGTLSGIPGVGQMVGQIFDTIVAVLGDLSNGIAEVNEEIERMQRGFALIDISNLVVTERVSRGGLLGWLGFTKEAIDEELTEWRLQIASGLEAGFVSGIGGAVRSILTGADDSIEALEKGLEQAVTTALIDAVINSAIIGGMLAPWLEALTVAIASGDFDTARDIVASIQAQLPAIAAALDEILEPFKGIFTPDPEELQDQLESMVEDLSPLNPRYGMDLDFAVPPSIQLAIATPLIDSANAFGHHVNTFGETVDVFNNAVNRAIPMIDTPNKRTNFRLAVWR